jgi:hypothetical protein
MKPQDFWNLFADGLTPAEFVYPMQCTDPEECVGRYFAARPTVYGVVRRKTWRETFEAERQFTHEVVASGLIAYLEETREEWEPLLEQMALEEEAQRQAAAAIAAARPPETPAPAAITAMPPAEEPAGGDVPAEASVAEFEPQSVVPPLTPECVVEEPVPFESLPPEPAPASPEESLAVARESDDPVVPLPDVVEHELQETHGPNEVPAEGS